MRYMYLVTKDTRAVYVTERRTAIKVAKLHSASVYRIEYGYWRDTQPWNISTFCMLGERIF